MNGIDDKALDGLRQIRALIESGRGAPMVEKLATATSTLLVFDVES